MGYFDFLETSPHEEAQPGWKSYGSLTPKKKRLGPEPGIEPAASPRPTPDTSFDVPGPGELAVSTTDRASLGKPPGGKSTALSVSKSHAIVANAWTDAIKALERVSEEAEGYGATAGPHVDTARGLTLRENLGDLRSTLKNAIRRQRPGKTPKETTALSPGELASDLEVLGGRFPAQLSVPLFDAAKRLRTAQVHQSELEQMREFGGKLAATPTERAASKASVEKQLREHELEIERSGPLRARELAERGEFLKRGLASYEAAEGAEAAASQPPPDRAVDDPGAAARGAGVGDRDLAIAYGQLFEGLGRMYPGLDLAASINWRAGVGQMAKNDEEFGNLMMEWHTTRGGFRGMAGAQEAPAAPEGGGRSYEGQQADILTAEHRANEAARTQAWRDLADAQPLQNWGAVLAFVLLSIVLQNPEAAFTVFSNAQERKRLERWLQDLDRKAGEIHRERIAEEDRRGRARQEANRIRLHKEDMEESFRQQVFLKTITAARAPKDADEQDKVLLGKLERAYAGAHHEYEDARHRLESASDPMKDTYGFRGDEAKLAKFRTDQIKLMNEAEKKKRALRDDIGRISGVDELLEAAVGGE